MQRLLDTGKCYCISAFKWLIRDLKKMHPLLFKLSKLSVVMSVCIITPNRWSHNSIWISCSRQLCHSTSGMHYINVHAHKPFYIMQLCSAQCTVHDPNLINTFFLENMPKSTSGQGFKPILCPLALCNLVVCSLCSHKIISFMEWARHCYVTSLSTFNSFKCLAKWCLV